MDSFVVSAIIVIVVATSFLLLEISLSEHQCTWMSNPGRIGICASSSREDVSRSRNTPVRRVPSFSPQDAVLPSASSAVRGGFSKICSSLVFFSLMRLAYPKKFILSDNLRDFCFLKMGILLVIDDTSARLVGRIVYHKTADVSTITSSSGT